MSVTFLIEPKLISLHTVKCFQVLLSCSYDSIRYQSFVWAQLNGFKYSYLTLIILKICWNPVYIYKYTYIYIYIYICVMQSFSNELSTSPSDNVKCKQTKFNTYALIPVLILSRRLRLGVCHQPDIKLGGFRSH